MQDPINLTGSSSVVRSNTYHYTSIGQVDYHINGESKKTTFTYDDTWQLASVVDPLGHGNSYASDSRGNLESATNGVGKTTTYTYDTINRLVTQLDAAGAKTHSFV